MNRPQGVDIGDASVRYGGRTLKLDVVINTDEPLEQVVARVLAAAKGPGKRMALVGGGEIAQEQAKEFWSGVLPGIRQQATQGGVT